tara:strand:+ start:1794 stop:6218 length:4425 start_codon:yes stop_codon:yes gene_type:complete
MARKFLNGVQSYFNNSNYSLLGHDSLDVVGGDLKLKRAGSTKLTLGTSTSTFAGNIAVGGDLMPSTDGGGSLGKGSGTNLRWNGIELQSGAGIQWQNGDARIIEGLVNNYSLSFQTYDGSSMSTALRLEGNNNAIFLGNVGIGNNTPAKTLTVDLNNTNTTVLTGSGLSGGTAGSGLLILNAAADSAGLYANLDFRAFNADGRIAYVYNGTNDGDFHFITDNGANPQTRLFIKNDGKIGIGTSSPQEKLDISAGSIRLDNNQRITWADADANVGRVRITGNESSDFITFVTDNAEKMRLTNTGLGIGTTSPSSPLHVYDTSSDRIAVFESNDNKAFIQISDNDTTGYVSSENGLFSLGRNEGVNANNININASNNVGIGTTSPSEKLHILGSTNTSVKALIQNNSTGTNAYATLGFQSNQNHSVHPGLFLTGSNNTNYAGTNSLNMYQHGNFPLGFVTSNQIRMTVTGAGDVGIGTTSPSTQLHLASATGPRITLEDTDTSVGINSIIADISFVGGEIGGETARIGAVSETNDGEAGLRFYTGSSVSERLRIDRVGRVGIGVTPSYDFHLQSSGAPTKVFIENDGSNQASVDLKNDDRHVRLITDSNHAFRIFDQTATVDRFKLDNSGFINIPNAYITLKNINNHAQLLASSSSLMIAATNIQAQGNLIPDGTGNRNLGASNRYWAETFTNGVTSGGNIVINSNTPVLTLGVINSSTGNAKIQLYSKNSGASNGYALQYNKDTGIDRLEFIDGSGNANIKFNNGGAAEFAGSVTATQINTGQGATEVHLMNQNLRTTDDVTFDDLTVTGNFTVTGTVNTVSSTNLVVQDKTITVGKNQTESASGGSGLIVDGSGASILWDETNDSWDFNKKIDVADHINLTDGKHLLWGGNAIVTHTGSATQIGDNSSGSVLTIASGNSSFTGHVNAANGFRMDSGQAIDFIDTNIGFNSIERNTTVGGLQINTGDSASMNILDNGRVGIGTNGPESKLHIIDGDSSVQLRLNQTGDNDAVLGSGTNFFQIKTGNGGNSAALAIMHSNQNVGIGTTSPAVKLHVDGFARLNGGLQLNQNGAVQIYQIQNNDLRFGTNNTERMRILSDGKVGIGTTTPQRELEVRNSSGTGFGLISGTTGAELRFRPTNSYSANGNFGIEVTGTTSSPFTTTMNFTGFHSNETTVMTLKGDQKVGIATASPTAPLTFGKSVYGAFDSEDFYRIKFQDQGGIHNDVGIGQTASGSMGFNITAGNSFIFNNGTSGEIARFNGTGLGIGTNNPGAKLQVNGSTSNTSANAFIARNSLGTSLFSIRNDGRVDVPNGAIVHAGGGYANTSTNDSYFTGKLGIGTTSPQTNTKLDVNGAIRAGGKTSWSNRSGLPLTTTGRVVAGITGNASGNGASALYIFTCYGGSGYQRIVYSIINVGGTWQCHKDIDEGQNVFDVVASTPSSGSAVTFTFKARSSNQSFTASVFIEHLGHNLDTQYVS